MRATSAAPKPDNHQTERTSKATRTEVRRTSSNRQQSGKKRLRLWAVLMIALCSWAVYTLIGQSSVIADKAAELETTREAKVASEAKLNDVQAEIKRLQDPEYIAQIARKEYNMFKPEEIPIRVTGEGGGE
ncbi:FtsB family cell division protein [Saccharibacillus alkalitolerans]|uniref:Septum formation initiator family protein n=1 Tax=Saccharibacillus alkalitolerans TaxID=2705290 RepID=A0ABX0FCG3_9BACL|nr:septum formation initiator family protein [Saccharibacillus alkalitolerans]NGZ78140.1 septum formation initiator family protein [Saccharibacillus alkalitolerans]